MRVFTSGRFLGRVLGRLKAKGRTIGFVPTMGCLHEGHLTLFRRCRRENDFTVASIFVNPLQFGPGEDYRTYPQTLGSDKRLLEKEKADFLFVPRVRDFYPRGYQTEISVRLLSRSLCGVSRPTHFAGVATGVLKLLNWVRPDTLYLGQKDYQQYLVLRQMVEDLDVDVRVKLLPVVREADGLAMSSRNALLSSEERKEAPLLHKALEEGLRLIQSGARRAPSVKQHMRRIFRAARHGRVDYLEIVDAQRLTSVQRLKKKERIVLAGAVFFKRTRLIDNILLEV